jgi:hypothetical protein
VLCAVRAIDWGLTRSAFLSSERLCDFVEDALADRRGA